MSDKTDLDENAQSQSPLSAMAENLLGMSPETINELKDKTREEIMHELQVHQIELEMQNEELKRVQLELEKSKDKYQDKYQNLYDFAPVGYFTLTRKGLIKEVNLCGAALVGIPRQELIGRGFGYFVAPESLGLWDKHIFAAHENEKTQSCDLTLKRKDESPFCAHLDSKRIDMRAKPQENTGETFSISMVVSDISERKMAEAEIKALNEDLEKKVSERTAELVRANQELIDDRESLRRMARALKALSCCNKNMVMTQEELALLRSICQVLVEVGEYRMAWVGYALEDEAKTVQPITHAGFEEGYLQSVRITWADEDAGRGPTGTAIRKGMPQINRNSATNPYYNWWRTEATSRGYASSIALPLSVNKRVIGALTVYASEPDAFDQEELELLTQLADDVSYGITALRTRLEREQAQQELERMRRRHELILTSAWEGIFGLDLDGNYTFVNPAAAKMLGREARDLIGQRCHLIRPQETVEDSLCLEEGSRIPSMLLDGVPLHLTDEVFWTIDGTVFPVEITITPIVEKGKINGSVVTFWDITERKQAEKERLANLIEIQDLYHNAPCGYHSLDPNGKFVRVNQTESMWLGYTRDEMLGGMKFTDILTSESVKTFEKTFPAFKQGGLIKDLKFELVRKEGTIFPVLLNATAIKGSSGEYIMSRSTVFDITEQERNQKILLQSEQRYKALYEDSSDGVLLMDASTTILDANNKAVEIFGYSLTELRSKKVSDLIDPQSFETKPFIFEMMLDGETIRLERPMFTKSGELIFVELTARRVGENLFQGIYRDVSERKQAEEELKKSEQRFKAIFEGANDLIFIKDLSFRYTHVNPATAKLFGIPASEILGKTSEDFFDKEAARYIVAIDTRVLNGERIEDLNIRKVKGIPMTFHDVRVPMRNESGEIIGVCGISRDVTDLNRIQDTKKLEPEEYRSEVMKSALELATFAASGKSVILLLGESGSGKDYIAKYIHERSDYSSGPYFSINCASIPSELAESELFGHEAGAFTGAVRQKRGLLELAEGGTLLLNEVGELSPALQAKLLTFLDTRTFT
ncbi:MAG: PAS domain S-box protein, partial [Desulfomonilaceae bacterium]